MIFYEAEIEWMADAAQYFSEQNVKYAPIIKSSAFDGADEPGWMVNITERNGKADMNCITFHFVSPDIPDMLEAGDDFTLWYGCHLIGEGRIIRKA